MMCKRQNETTPRGDIIPRPPVCDAAGDLLSCQLCPVSPTYWEPRYDRTPPNPDAHGLPIVERPDTSHLITGEGWRMAPAGSICTICFLPTMLVSPKGTPCHKTCAEDWTKARNARRTTAPA